MDWMARNHWKVFGGIVLIFMLFVSVVYAQEVLSGKIPVMNGTCYFDKDVHLAKGAPYSAPCILTLDPDREDAMWIVLFHQGKPVIVIEVSMPAGEQKIVWRKGDLST